MFGTLIAYNSMNWSHSQITEKAKPAEKQGRKATGFTETAGLPKLSRVASEKWQPGFFVF